MNIKLQAQVTLREEVGGVVLHVAHGYSWDSVASCVAKLEQLAATGDLVKVEWTKSIFA